MNRKIFTALVASFSLGALAQTDPVVMTVNGVDVPRSEFEYSYNKNRDADGSVEQKSVEEYAEMYLNYKLKVAAARDAQLDTVAATQKEFLTYRNLQLTPYLIDQAFIDSVAHAVYDRQAEQLGGKDILYTQHIFVALPSNANADFKAAVLQRADSIRTLVVSGADFDETARQLSENPQTARGGGRLQPLGPGLLPEDVEKQLYAVEKGQISQPILMPDGYHIFKMLDRHPLQPYSELETGIKQFLKSQNIEEMSAQHRMDKLIAASGGRLTREAILDSVLAAHVGTDADLRYLVQEYQEGLILYELSQQKVWGAAEADEALIAQFYADNKAKYAWTAPHFKGRIVQAKDKKTLKKATAFAKKHLDEDNLSDQVKETFNKTDGIKVRVSRALIVQQGDNKFVDEQVFKQGKAPESKDFPVFKAVGRKLKAPESYKDVRSAVVTDLQAHLEQEWVNKLRSTYSYSIDKDVLSTVNNH